MSSSCLYCISQINDVVSCTNSCLVSSSIPPSYPTSILFGSIALSAAFFFFAFYFRHDLKRFIGFRLASIAFLSTAVFTLGLIFNGHFILKNLPFIIPGVAISSYLLSYILSFYLVKFSYKPIAFENKTFQGFLFKLSKKLNIRLPGMYVFFSKEPKAFVVDGLKKAIFISDSLIEKLDEKYIKAVLLHELYHLKRGTGMIKNLISSIATLNFKIIPVPIKELERYEEEEIDKILLEKHGMDIEKVKSKLWDFN